MPEIGLVGQEKLAKTRVAVVGGGGLGCPVAIYLAAAGIGHIDVIDDDVVSLSNLQRQILFRLSDIDRPKAEVVADACRGLSATQSVYAINERIASTNALRLLSGAQIVVDCTDNFDARYIISDAALQLKIPHVWGSVFRFEGQVATFHPRAGATYRDAYPSRPPDRLSPNCASGGVAAPMCGVIGSLMAVEALTAALGLTDFKDPAQITNVDGRLRDFTVFPIVSSAARTALVGPQSESPHRTTDPAREISAGDAAGELSGSEPPILVDVRMDWERRIRRIRNSVHIELGQLQKVGAAAFYDAVEPGSRRGRVLVYCESGVRSAQAADVLLADGVLTVASIAGGIKQWVRLGHEVEEGDSS